MFGKPKETPPVPKKHAASDAARIEGGGLVQLIVTDLTPLAFHLFLNDKYIPQFDVESLTISIGESGTPGDTASIYATLAFQAANVSGETSVQRIALFPCTFEMVALGRRISITAMNANSFDGLWISLGLKPTGEGSEITGAKSLRILLTDTFLDAKLTWEDGETEDLLPQH